MATQVRNLGRLFFVVFVATFIALPSIATQAREREYYFASDSSCGDIAPIQPELDTWLRGGRDHLSLGFTITEQQIAAAECSGSHFDVIIYLDDFSRRVDWSGCNRPSVNHDFTFGTEIVDEGDGSATVVVSGAKLTDGRMNPGDSYEINLTCPELRFGSRQPVVRVQYRPAWYSTERGPGYEETRFETSGTNGPAGLPVYMKYSGQDAWLTNSDGDIEFPFDD